MQIMAAMVNHLSVMLDQCLSALEELDSFLLRASRKDPGASIYSMKAQIVTLLNALDSLLKILPGDVLEKGKSVADSYFFLLVRKM